jgi:trehalose 6-phosphate phosphatase
MSDLQGMPPPGRAALLLDFDGTLVDIAPAPDRVVVPDDLLRDLTRVRAACGGALAIVTGRPLDQLDALLGDGFAAAGEHGTALRAAPCGTIEHVDVPDAPWHWVGEAQAAASRHPGALIEPKRHGFVVHYRGAPAAKDDVHRVLQRLVAEWPEAFAVQPAKMAWEVRPLAANKGTAVRALMARAPFFGRVPVFVGDDVTDEDGMAAARKLGGLGYRVPEVFGDAACVRDWIARLASTLDGAASWAG